MPGTQEMPLKRQMRYPGQKRHTTQFFGQRCGKMVKPKKLKLNPIAESSPKPTATTDSED